MQTTLDILEGIVSVSDILSMPETETPESEVLDDDTMTAYAIALWEISTQNRAGNH